MSQPIATVLSTAALSTLEILRAGGHINQTPRGGVLYARSSDERRISQGYVRQETLDELLLGGFVFIAGATILAVPLPSAPR